jgi:hypothetical protein
MELLYKPDWEKTKERMTAWWAHEDFGRCAISIMAEKSGVKYEEPPKTPEKVEDRWLDLDYLNTVHVYRMKRTFYGGEAIPVWNTGDGWIQIAGYVGCPIELKEETGWVEPIIDKGELTDNDYHNIKINPDNKWWKFADKIHQFAAEKAKDKSIPCIQAIGGCADTLASIRGTQNLLFDVIECPEYVRDFEVYLMKQWIEVYEKFYNIINESAEGSTTWPSVNVWSPGRYYLPMCDFSYMISPKMFTDIFLPSIEMQINYLDHSLYHLDGVGAFAHIDVLCELPKLDAIQILPGTGKPSALHYMDVLKKVQRAKKNLQIYLEPEEVEIALENLSSKGLFITTKCKTEEDARDILKKVEKLSRVRKV